MIRENRQTRKSYLRIEFARVFSRTIKTWFSITASRAETVSDEEHTGTSHDGTVKNSEEAISALNPKIMEIPMMKIMRVEIGLARMICIPEMSM